MTSEKSASNATLDAVSHQFIETNGLRMHIAEQGTGPLVLLCHGFPELWNAWRYQFPALSEAGYRVAPDLRGYGQTDQPDNVEVYTLLHLVGDLIGVLDVLGEQRAILVGHDWGAALAWHAALLRPDRFPVLICMSAPYVPRGPLHGTRATLPPTQAWKQVWGDQCFYQSYFQRPGVAEAEFERDVRTTMRRLLYGLSGDAPSSERWHPLLPDPQAGALNSAGNPNNLAALYRSQGKYEQAEPIYQRALAIYEQVHSTDHPDTAACLHSLALLYTNQGKYEQAEPLLKRALAIYEQVLGPQHPSTKTVHANYASLLEEMKRNKK